jgi:hypothetical protein
MTTGPLELAILAFLTDPERGPHSVEKLEVSQHIWNGLLYEKGEAVDAIRWDGNIMKIPVELHRDMPASWGRGRNKFGAIVGVIVFP